MRRAFLTDGEKYGIDELEILGVVGALNLFFTWTSKPLLSIKMNSLLKHKWIFLKRNN